MSSYTPKQWFKKGLDVRKPGGLRKQLKSEIRKERVRTVEKKFTDTIWDMHATGNANIAGFDFPSTQTATKITTIQQGTADAAQRIGDKVELAGIYLRVQFQCRNVLSYARVIVFQWQEDDGAAVPTIGSILQPGAVANAVFAPYRHDGSTRYSILYDKVMRLVENDTNETAMCMYKNKKSLAVRKKFKFEPLIRFNAATPDGVNNLYILAFTSKPAGGLPATDSDLRSMYCRVTYRDA